MLQLSTPVTDLRMVGPLYGNKLLKLGISTIDDLIHHIPFRYEDYSLISKIASLQMGEKVTVVGKIESIKNIYTKNGKKIQQAMLSDDAGKIEVIWYNQPFLTRILKKDLDISICGTVNFFGNHLSFESPDYEIIKPTTDLVHTGRLVPIYPQTEGLSSKWIRSRIYSVLTKFNPVISEFLPDFILKQYHLMSEKEAVYQIHFPDNNQNADRAKRRLAFDELFLLTLSANLRRQKWESEIKGKSFNINKIQPKINKFIEGLPFTLTSSQTKAINEILNDLTSAKPMNRLLEGDVGSGKTVVSAVAIYASYLSGFQSAFMAPTEILAKQHYKTLSDLLAPAGVKIAYFSGSTNKNRKSKTHEVADLYIGTHALLSQKIKINKLQLAVIDEQQRFGVTQRAVLREKGSSPHLLTMTATPIPRTIALTIYADLDLSIIDELPSGRKQIKTWVVPAVKREAAYNWIRKQVTSQMPRQQAFIVCPFIEISESMDTVKAAKKEYEHLSKTVFPDLRLGLLHGKMKSTDKDKILTEFKKGNLDILVSTPVVEVGIDIPNATVMMIEASDRFGLSQLHQLRGRVGRNDMQSYCLLFTENQNENTIKRLKLLETTFIGPKLADLDMELRGPGELYGTKQHGELGLRIADFSDITLFREAKDAGSQLLANDSKLSRFTLLQEKLQKYTIKETSQD